MTKITEAEIHQPTLTLCHRSAMTTPKPFPYLCVTVVLLTDGGELSPHKDIQNHRVHQNATISFGEWEGGVLQVLEDDRWINKDFLNARDTYHRVTEVTGYRLSITYHTPQHLHRLTPDDWEALRDSGFPVDAVWKMGLSFPEKEEDEEFQEAFRTLCESIHMTHQITPGSEEPDVSDRVSFNLPDPIKMRPTLQAILWISEIIAKSDRSTSDIPLDGPRTDPAIVSREMDYVRTKIRLITEAKEMSLIVLHVAEMLIAIIRLTICLGMQGHLGLMLLYMCWIPKK